MQPIIAVKKEEAEKQLVVVSGEKAKADEIRVKVSAEEADAKVVADKAEGIKTKCSAELAKAIPIQESAKAAIKCIEKSHIATLKKMLNPPKALIPVGNVLCIFWNRTPATKIDDPLGSGKKVPDWWKETIAIMSQMSFLQDLMDYDDKSITQQLIDKISPFLDKPEMTPDALAGASSVASNLAKWMFAMKQVYEVNLIVTPLQADLNVAQAEFAEVSKVLAVKQAALKEVMD